MATSDKDSGYVDNWQTGKTVIDCNLHMLTTEDCSDVIFRVGTEKVAVRAHCYVLISRSCVFHAMFCGPLAEKGEIAIPDIEPHVFKAFLRYLYSDRTAITADTVTGLLYASRKYAVDTLQQMCVTFLEKSLSEDNVCQILEHCHGYGEVDLEQKALNILTEAGLKIIKSPGFVKLCVNCFGKFLQSDQLHLVEEDVFEAALSWAKRKCAEEGVSSNPENLKKILGELRYEIRFTDLTLEYLVNVVGPSGLLTDTERIRIVDKSVNTNVDISPFKHIRRRSESRLIQQNKLPTQSVSRFGSLGTIAYVTSGTSDFHREYVSMPCSGDPEAVSFSVSKDISLVGCQLYGPCYSSQSIYRLKIVLYDSQDQVIAQPVLNTDKTLRGDWKLNDVMFPDPVPLVARLTYSICVNMTGENTYCGTNKQSSVTVYGVTFSFSDSKHSRHKRGQIPGLIWR